MATINRNPITTQPTQRPTNANGEPLYLWPDGTLHTTTYESQHRNPITVQPTAPPPSAGSVGPGNNAGGMPADAAANEQARKDAEAAAAAAEAKRKSLEAWYLGTGTPQNWETDNTAIYGRTNTQGYAHEAGHQRYFPSLTGDQQTFYATNPDQAYAAAVGQEASPDSYYKRWLDNQWSDVKNGLNQAQLKDKNITTPDYIETTMQGLAHRYLQLPGWQQGKNPGTWFAGRQN